MKHRYQELLDQYPFLTVVSYAGKEYLGIMQNVDTHIASMYIYDRLKSIEEKQLFLELGEEWWWETNRQLPINLSLLNRWPFRECTQSFNVMKKNL